MHDLDTMSLQREGELEDESYELDGEQHPAPPRPAPPRAAPSPPRPRPPQFHHHHFHHQAGASREAEITELAAELLSLSNEGELEAFLGDVIHAVKGAIDSPTGKAIIHALKPIAKQIIPAATEALGGALGGLVTGGVGAPIGGALGGAAGNALVHALGLELEGLSPEDRELEVAKQFVRLAEATAESAAKAPPQSPPQTVARAALVDAAKRVAPSLLGTIGAPPHPQEHPHERRAPFEPAPPVAAGGAMSGQWFRQGNKIVLVGV